MNICIHVHIHKGSGEMTQMIRTLASLPEDLSWFSDPMMVCSYLHTHPLLLKFAILISGNGSAKVEPRTVNTKSKVKELYS